MPTAMGNIILEKAIDPKTMCDVRCHKIGILRDDNSLFRFVSANGITAKGA